MKVYGLVGKSGTGKSFQSMNVCRDRRIAAIIDDGLFICDNSVQAGHSAKRDENKMTAIKTAIFNEEDHRRAVAESIKEINPPSILVLGTSESMICKICSRLEIPEPAEMIRIEDIADQDEINTALRQRREKGKHVIPVPTFEIKKDFSGYFMTPLNMFKSKGRNYAENEKSVVRPTYSYLGEFIISPRAVQQLAEYAASKSAGVVSVEKCTYSSSDKGVIITVVAVFEYDRNLRQNICDMQESLAKDIERMTAFNIIGINVIVKGLRLRKDA